jgi:two-component system LytT family response regulator
VKDRERFLLLKPEEVEWIHSAANYAELHARGRSFLVRMTMSELEERLDPIRFVRIHRSTIVNVDRVAEIQPAYHGEFQVVLQDGAKLRLSRRYRDRLLP